MAADCYKVQDVWIERRQNGAEFRLEVPEFRVGQGEFISLVGSTGCGKSTLLDMLGLVLQPDYAATFEFSCPKRGALDLIRLSGRKRAQLRREQFGYVLQTGGLLGFLNVKENILLSAKLKGRIHHKRKQLHELTTRLGIRDQLSKKPQFLSGGQRQRASIARALIHGPTLVLADEPTASVDRLTATKIVDELKRLAATKKVSVIMVSHDTKLVTPPVSDRTYTFEIRQAHRGTVVSRCVEQVSKTDSESSLL